MTWVPNFKLETLQRQKRHPDWGILCSRSIVVAGNSSAKGLLAVSAETICKCPSNLCGILIRNTKYWATIQFIQHKKHD